MTTAYDVLTELIRSKFPGFSPQFQRGARFLLDNPDEVAVLSMRKVAWRAEVQPAALVRLAQQMGYPGWSELREVFVSRIRTRPEPLTAKAKSLVKEGSSDLLSLQMGKAQASNLDVTTSRNAELIVKVANILRKAPHVHIAGFRSCYGTACSMQYGYRLFRSSVSLIDGGAGTLEMQLRGIEKRHAVVVVSFAPYSVEAVRVARAAEDKGAHLIALTDSAVSPIALDAEQSLIFTHDTPSFFPSLIAAGALGEMLIAQLLALEGADAIAELEATESGLHGQGAYAT
ncbi:MurR/RpiR family transcriptional regulator [Pusillimonas sp. SM2304]|uniref:MurR/RpiR family transcriptional regulator n=1 Tax=Pusillimonas sp. SM2304 TaxID=3073241 RepID=UPI0028762CAE|nr:MurR/RpiR family transcriptional regulator [Pusillimonas sp. SM2304]MDS1138881.1 MurR/RpiR family transcriptional regulator [Pusillimonas sp. SM2304]